MGDLTLIDTNIICRHALQDHDEHSPHANQLFLSLARGTEKVYCPATAVFEAIHIMHGRNGAPREEVGAYFRAILNYPGVETHHPAAILNALDFWAKQPRLDYADCYHLALAEELGMTQIYSFDKKMDRYPGVERIEPEAADV